MHANGKIAMFDVVDSLVIFVCVFCYDDYSVIKKQQYISSYMFIFKQ